MPEDLHNPYAPPAILTETSGIIDCYIREGYMLIRTGSSLPEKCPITGQEVKDPALRMERSVSWIPYWIFATGVLGIIPLIVLSILLKKKGSVTLSLSAQAKQQVLKKKAGAVLCGVGGISIFLFCLLKGDPSLTIPGVTGILMTILGPILYVLAEPLRPVGYENGWFIINNCSVRFLKSLPLFPEEKSI